MLMQGKTTIFLAAVGFTMAAASATSCKKSSPAALITSTFSATLGDSSYQPSSEWISVNYAPVDTGFTITGEVIGTNTQLFLTFAEPFTLNVPISTQTSGAIVAFESNTTTGVVFEARGPNNTHANITVTAWDPLSHTIAGNFSGVLYEDTDSLVVTNGVFDVSYPRN